MICARKPIFVSLNDVDVTFFLFSRIMRRCLVLHHQSSFHAYFSILHYDCIHILLLKLCLNCIMRRCDGSQIHNQRRSHRLENWISHFFSFFYLIGLLIMSSDQGMCFQFHSIDVISEKIPSRAITD